MLAGLDVATNLAIGRGQHPEMRVPRRAKVFFPGRQPADRLESDFDLGASGAKTKNRRADLKPISVVGFSLQTVAADA